VEIMGRSGIRIVWKADVDARLPAARAARTAAGSCIKVGLLRHCFAKPLHADPPPPAGIVSAVRSVPGSGGAPERHLRIALRSPCSGFAYRMLCLVARLWVHSFWDVPNEIVAELQAAAKDSPGRGVGRPPRRAASHLGSSPASRSMTADCPASPLCPAPAALKSGRAGQTDRRCEVAPSLPHRLARPSY
jgi:hypothetical protein